MIVVMRYKKVLLISPVPQVEILHYRQNLVINLLSEQNPYQYLNYIQHV